MQQAIEPQWESKSDYWIFSQLAERLGCQEAFTEGLDEMGWIRRLYGDAQKMGERIGVKLPNFEDFWKKGYVLFASSSHLKTSARIRRHTRSIRKAG